jgi:hypothetical protein
MNIEIATKANAQNVENALIVEAIVLEVNAEAEVAAAVAHTEALAAALKRTQNAPLTRKLAMQRVPMTASKK